MNLFSIIRVEFSSNHVDEALRCWCDAYGIV